mmetsp:Transcript_4575/g.13390  ORF Transcript_4575/g.13390 Transcript_4575/m.13390 type:complete len:87 (-) Transcript_4575:964-1224(-)
MPTLLARLNARANNGIHAVCALPPWGNRELCAAKQYGNCRENIRAASARAALLGMAPTSCVKSTELNFSRRLLIASCPPRVSPPRQ